MAFRSSRGTEVAIALGSRGIVDLQSIVRRVVVWVRSQGAEPFVVSAMGSHGGATAEGQREVLASYGLDETGLGCPVRVGMDVIALPAEVGGRPVVFDAEASRASATIVVNRVKPHTDFHGPYESGLMKMIAIGLGNQVQAERIHAHGSSGLRTLMPEIATQVLAHGNVVLGVAIVENALEQVMAIEAVPAADIIEVEAGAARPGPSTPAAPAGRRARRAARRPDRQGHQRRGHGHQRHRPHDDPRRAGTAVRPTSR